MLLGIGIVGGFSLAGGAPWFLTVIEWAIGQLAKFTDLDPISFSSDADALIRYGGVGICALSLLGVIAIAFKTPGGPSDQFDINVPEHPITFAQFTALIGNRVGKAIVLEGFTHDQENEILVPGRLYGADYVEVLEAVGDKGKSIPPYDVQVEGARVIIRATGRSN